jgi:fucose permease
MIAVLLLLLIYLAFISLGLPDALLGSAWPSMYGALPAPLHYAGILAMIIAGGTVVSSIFSERVIRRLGTGLVTAISVFMTAAALIGFSLSHTFISLCFCAVPLGFGAGSVDAALNNYVALHYKARHMSWLHCFWGVGASAGPLIMAAYLTNGSPWNSAYRTVGVIQFCLVLLLFISLPLWGKHTREAAAAQEQKRSISYRELFRIPGVKQILVTFFCYCSIEQITGLWGSSYLVRVRNAAPDYAARLIALYYGGITVGRFISGFLTMKLNNRQMVRLGQGLIACGIITLLLPFGTISLVSGFFIIGLGCAPIYPSLIHETPKNFGSEYSQAIIGIQMATAYIGITVMPPLFGWIASHTNFTIFPVFIGIILILKIVMSETVNKKVNAG